MTTRTQLRRLTLPAAIAYSVLMLLSLLARIVLVVAALVADVAERCAIAGDAACAAARGPVVVTTVRGAA